MVRRYYDDSKKLMQYNILLKTFIIKQKVLVPEIAVKRSVHCGATVAAQLRVARYNSCAAGGRAAILNLLATACQCVGEMVAAGG